MADIYRISLEDEASGNAYRIAQAYVEVSIAAKRMRNAVVMGDKVMQQSARETMAFANNELRAARAAQTAGNAIARLGPKMSATTNATAGATKEGFKFSYMMNALANQAVNLGFRLVRNLASSLIEVGQGLYGVADLASRAHMSFANFYGGQASGDKVLNESIDLAKRYGYTIKDVNDQMNRFGAAGFSAEQAKGTLRFGADMLAAGRSVQDVKGIFLAMTQIMGKGKLQAEELTQQLAERGINAGRVWQILGGILHKTVPEVMALQKAGKIGSGIALNAIVQAGVEGVHGGQIGKAGEKVADATIGGLGRRMSTLIESEVFKAVDNASPALVKGMQSIFHGMDASTYGALGQGLTTTLEGVGKFMEMIGPKIPAMVDGFTKAFGAASGFNPASWQSFADGLPKVAESLGTIAGLLAKIAGYSTAILHPLDTMGANFQRFGNYITGAGYKTSAETNLVTEQAGVNMALDANNRKSGDDMIAEAASQSLAQRAAENILVTAPSIAGGAPSIGAGAIGASQDTIYSPQNVRALGRGIGAAMTGISQDPDIAMHSGARLPDAAIGASAGALGLNTSRAENTASAAGTAVSNKRSVTVKVGDIQLGGGNGAGGYTGPAEDIKSYFETEFPAMLERHLEGNGG